MPDRIFRLNPDSDSVFSIGLSPAVGERQRARARKLVVSKLERASQPKRHAIAGSRQKQKPEDVPASQLTETSSWRTAI